MIVKAEILWSRTCPLSCSYCAMPDGRKNSPTIEQWREGFLQLEKLGCSFAAFYGAEPLHDFDKLPEVIQFAEAIGIHTTVITSGVSDNVNEKIKTLYEHGLRSLTTSYDEVYLDSSSKIKTNKAIGIIHYFRSLGPVRDTAIVVTVSKKNYLFLPSIIRDMSSIGVWTFFDLLHPYQGQPGSKTKGSSYDLLLQESDREWLIKILNRVLTMKEEGYLCHASKQFIQMVKETPSFTQFNWNCGREDNFPAWVTVDCDGTVYPCDDFQPDYTPQIPVWKIYDNWNEFKYYWKSIVMQVCPGCLRNTHIDAHLIKRGQLPLTDYIHGLK